MSWKGTTPTTQFGASSNGASGSNVPDYQKMLQHHVYSPGWGTSANNATSYNRHTTYRTVSPPRDVSPPFVARSRHTDSLSTTAYGEPKLYNPTFELSQYPINSDNQYDMSYVSKEFGELSMENTVRVINDDEFDKTAPYGPTKYTYNSYDADRKRVKTNNYLTSHRRSTDFDLERPSNVPDDSEWSSPQKKASVEGSDRLYTTAALSRSSANKAVNYGRVERAARQTTSHKSTTGDLYVGNGEVRHRVQGPRAVGRDAAGYRPASVGAVSTDDLTNWQKHHQDQQLQIEEGFGKDTGGHGFDRSAEKDTLVDKLRRQVMRLEDEVKEYEEKLRRAIMKESDEGSEAYAQIKIEQLEAEKDEWKMKFLNVKDSHHSLKQKQDELQRYLTSLPTLEEAAKQEHNVRSLSSDNQLQKEHIAELERQLLDTRKVLSSRDLHIEEMDEKGSNLAQKVSILTEEIDHFKSVGQGAALRQKEEQLQNVQEENDKLSNDLEKAKKLLETCHRKIRHQDVKHQNSMRQLEDRLGQEEGMVNSLREDDCLREEQAAKLRGSLKQLQTQNQELLDQNLTLREQVKHWQQLHSDDNQRLQAQFTTELGVCFSELKALVQICVQRAEGQDPNMSDLLGVRADVETAATGGPQVEAHTIKRWLSKTRELRTEIEQLRSLICNKYAEDIGDNLNCTTQ